MNKLDSTLRLFKQILPESTKRWDRVTLRKLQVWLSDDVATVVEELTRRPTFRDHAGWAIQALKVGSSSKERQVADSLEAVLSDAMKAYAKVLNNKRLHAQIRTSCPLRQWNVGQSVVDELDVDESQLRADCRHGRAAFNLINIEDYFGPRQKYAIGQDGTCLQVATHIVGLTPELHPVGNFVLQSAIVRLEIFLKLLTRMRHRVAVAAKKLGCQYAAVEHAKAAWECLQFHVRHFREALQSGRDNDLRNACMILTQVYAAFHAKPDLNWLGMPALLTSQARYDLQQRFISLRGPELIERVNGALMAMQQLYEDRDPQLSAREEAIARGDLVLVEQERMLYWEGKPISFVDRPAEWGFLLPLVKKAVCGGHVTELDVFGKYVRSRSAMPMRKKRLKLPGSLRKLIVKGPDPRTYRLDLVSSRIFVMLTPKVEI